MSDRFVRSVPKTRPRGRHVFPDLADHDRVPAAESSAVFAWPFAGPGSGRVPPRRERLRDCGAPPRCLLLAERHDLRSGFSRFSFGSYESDVSEFGPELGGAAPVGGSFETFHVLQGRPGTPEAAFAVSGASRRVCGRDVRHGSAAVGPSQARRLPAGCTAPRLRRAAARNRRGAASRRARPSVAVMGAWGDGSSVRTSGLFSMHSIVIQSKDSNRIDSRNGAIQTTNHDVVRPTRLRTQNDSGSSRGRTLAFDSSNAGSIPAPEATRARLAARVDRSVCLQGGGHRSLTARCQNENGAPASRRRSTTTPVRSSPQRGGDARGSLSSEAEWSGSRPLTGPSRVRFLPLELSNRVVSESSDRAWLKPRRTWCEPTTTHASRWRYSSGDEGTL
jgi:hypothetical protein